MIRLHCHEYLRVREANGLCALRLTVAFEHFTFADTYAHNIQFTWRTQIAWDVLRLTRARQGLPPSRISCSQHGRARNRNYILATTPSLAHEPLQRLDDGASPAEAPEPVAFKAVANTDLISPSLIGAYKCGSISRVKRNVSYIDPYANGR